MTKMGGLTYSSVVLDRIRTARQSGAIVMAVHKSCTIMAAILVVAFAHHVTAAVVIYDESVNGDLPVFGSPLPTMALDVGTNTVSGKSGDSGASFDFDSFAFTVPAGAQLLSANVTLTDSPGNSGDINDLSWGLWGGSADYAGGSFLEFITGFSPGTYSFTTPPLGTDVYNISASSAGSSGGAPKFSNYTFSFVVTSLAAVPEPATLLMWGLILAGAPFGAKAYRKLVAAEA